MPFDQTDHSQLDKAQPDKSPLDNVVIVLVEPQDPINVGNTIRAMKNMGLSRLRLVNPANANPHQIAISAPRADDLLDTMAIFDDLDAALADTLMTVALTARPRRARRVVERPRQIAEALIQRAAEGPVALIFGREDSGLPNEALDRAHVVATIPTRSDYSSLNLGQAVMVVAYELFLAGAEIPDLPGPKRDFPLADADQIAGLFEQIEDTLWHIEFLKEGTSKGVMRSLHALFNRAGLDEREARMLRGIFAEVPRYAERAARRSKP